MQLNLEPRIVVFRAGQLGDTLACFPAIQALHQAFPNSRIVYCTNSSNHQQNIVYAREVLELTSCVREVVSYSSKKNAYARYKELKSSLSPNRFDTLVYLQYNRVTLFQIIRDYIFFRLLGFRQLFGFKQSLIWFFYRKFHQTLPSEKDRLLRIVNELTDSTVPKIQIELDTEFKRDFFLKNQIESSTPLMAVAPGSKMQAKRWPVERYALVCKDWCLDHPNGRLVILGSEDERELCTKLKASLSQNSILVIGCKLTQVSAVLSECQIFLGNDSGLMPLADLMKIPIVAIFSARDKNGLWWPSIAQNEVFIHRPYCANCLKETCYGDPAPCLLAIDANLVTTGVRKLHSKLQILADS